MVHTNVIDLCPPKSPCPSTGGKSKGQPPECLFPACSSSQSTSFPPPDYFPVPPNQHDLLKLGPPVAAVHVNWFGDRLASPNVTPALLSGCACEACFKKKNKKKTRNWLSRSSVALVKMVGGN